MKNVLLILNDPPYGTERSFNGLRLAGSLAKRDDTEVRVFLIGDAVGCAMSNQQVPDGYYHLDRMIESAARHGADIGCCGTCLDARGIPEDLLTKGTHRSTLEELTDWTLWADTVITF
ncbi:MAG TPA: DsrE family protein [Acidimicrobiia bacterium]|nr:DsrE family protein [Acidimicrobiia bacterium]